MNSMSVFPSRRRFLASSAAVGALAMMPGASQSQSTQSQPTQTPSPATHQPQSPQSAPLSDPATINLIGPKPGYTPQIGTLVSMLTWVQSPVVRHTPQLTQAQLDTLFDKNANTLGALLLHLAATETYYQRNTFMGERWDSWPANVKAQWDAAMNLGDAGRASIKGHDSTFYLDKLREVRERSLSEFAKRDDAWLMTVDKDWPWGPTNNYCKWFHVCEHISHHAGQMVFLVKRLPGAAPGSDHS